MLSLLHNPSTLRLSKLDMTKKKFNLTTFFTFILFVGIQCQVKSQAEHKCLSVHSPTNSSRVICDLNSEQDLCVKIKFHFIKDISNTSAFPSDQVYTDLLKDLNNYFYRGKIRLVLEQDCIDKRSVNFELAGPRDLDNKLFYGSDADIAYYRSQLGYDETAFHIYSEYIAGGDGMALPGKNITYASLNSWHCCHEVGHMFALLHTHGWNQGVSPESYWECKNPQDPNDGSGDGIDDTGADPYSQDLSPKDGLPEYWNWMNETTCQQTIPASVPDKCGNTTLPWNIPVDNIMSYYPEHCKCFFTTGQFCKMREWITLRFPQYITQCNVTPSSECADILITSNVKWSNGTKKLCPNQKIIIRNNGILTLDNFILTRVNTNTTSPCSQVVKLGDWDGIYVEANKNSLIIKNNSIIEYSKNGIQALNGGRVSLENAIMRNNRMAIHCENDVRFALTNSEINVPKYCNTVQLRLMNTGAKIDNSKFINNTGKEVTALKSLNGRIDISSNTTFTGFQTAIEKESGLIGNGNGMSIEGSRFENCQTAIRNLGPSLFLTQNLIDGEVLSTGICSGELYGNNFRKKVAIQDPQSALKIEENYFYNNSLLLNGSNILTDLTCNQWANTKVALEGICTDLKIEWGTKNQSSGNIYLNNSMTMNINSSENVINWHFEQEPKSIFTYLGKNIGNNAVENRSCKYNLFPTYVNDKITIAESVSATWGDNDKSLEQQWSEENTKIQEVRSNDHIQNLQSITSQIQDATIRKDLIVQNAIKNSTDYDLEDHSWQQRLPSKMQELNQISEWFVQKQYAQIQQWCQANKNHESAKDIESLHRFIVWIRKAISQGKNIFDFSTIDKQEIKKLAEITHGDYSSLIRAFLNAYYDIRVDPKIEVRTAHTNEGDEAVSEPFTISPNPTSDFIKINLFDSKKTEIRIEVLSMDGKSIFYQNSTTDEYLNFKNLSPGLYILKIESVDKKHNQCSKVLVK